ncbi:MAG: DUF4328 domain-containing protein [Pirellulales bacterium]|nr:DUF4328 domain-containing protein [Pirellulales bacterium]
MSTNPYESPESELGQSSPAVADANVVPFVSGHVLSLITRILLGSYTILCGIAMSLFGVYLLLLMTTVLDDLLGENRNELVQAHGQLNQLRTALLVCTATSFLFWFHRAYRNLPALGAADLSFTPAGAVVCWFIPLLNLGRPYLFACEIWRASDPTFAGDADTRWRNAPLTWLIKSWWALWLMSFLLVAISRRLPQQSVEQAVTAAWTSLSAEALRAIAAILAILLVTAIDRRQEAKYEQRLRQGQSLAVELTPG